MRVFLTGVTGYVGTHVAQTLQARGDTVYALAHNTQAVAAVRARGFHPVEHDLADVGDYAGTLAEVDAVIHTAASDNPAFAEMNERATGEMLGAISPGAAFVMQGGSLVFGPHPNPDPAPPFAPPPFLEARASFEQRFLEGALWDAGRRAVVYGSFVHGGGGVFPTALAKAAEEQGFVPYPEDGAAVWSTVHVADWADLIVRAAASKNHGGHPIFAAAGSSTVADLAGALGDALGKPAKAVSQDEAAAMLGPLGAALSIPSHHSDAPALALGWRPKHVRITDSFADLASREGAR